MLTDRRFARRFLLLCFLVYFSSYITRINFGAVVSEIVRAEQMLKSSVSAVITAGFVFYGIGQIFSGFLGDRVAPNRMIFCGLIATAGLNLLIPLCTKIEQMSVVWSLNGLAQSMLWPPLLRILSEMLPPDQLSKGCVSVSIAASIGTIAVYLCSPVLILLAGWKLVFVVSGSVTAVAAFVWLVGFSRLSRAAGLRTSPPPAAAEKPASPERKVPFRRVLVSSGLVTIVLGIVLQGALRDGITTWIPSYLSETFHLNSSVSILMTVALPVVSILAFQVSTYLQDRVFHNELTSAAFLYAVGFGALLLLSFFSSFNALLSIALASLVTGAMHGINLMLVVLLPGRFGQYGRIAGISGLLNFFTYVGSAISAFGIARLTELFGWHASMFLWAAAALLGTILCAASRAKWRRFLNGAALPSQSAGGD